MKVGRGVAVGSGVGVGAGVAVGDGVKVGRGVAVGSGVGVGTGVAAGDGVKAGRGVAQDAGVKVGIGGCVFNLMVGGWSPVTGVSEAVGVENIPGGGVGDAGTSSESLQAAITSSISTPAAILQILSPHILFPLSEQTVN